MPLSLKFAVQNSKMKKSLLVLFAAALLFAACKSTDKKVKGVAGDDTAGKLSQEEKEKALKDSSNFTTLQWLDSTTKNLGTLVKDQSIEVTFHFRNTGKRNLIFESVTASCGCTVPEKPERPYAPGEEGEIKAKFNGSGHGAIAKSITAIANTTPSNQHILTFTGEIKE